MLTGIVVGAAPLLKEADSLVEYITQFIKDNKRDELYLVAADGGIEFFVQNSIAPDQFLGDMDSASEKLNTDDVRTIFKSMKYHACSPVKDVTDMEMGITLLLEKGCDSIMCYGGLSGRRISHSVANISLLNRVSGGSADITFIGDGIKMYVIKNGQTVFYDKQKKGYLSVIALSDVAENVVIKGLFYEFQGQMKNDFALGVSNEFCGKEAEISVGQGSLLIIEEEKGNI